MSQYFSRLAQRTGVGKPEGTSKKRSQTISSPPPAASGSIEENVTVEAPPIPVQPSQSIKLGRDAISKNETREVVVKIESKILTGDSTERKNPKETKPEKLKMAHDAPSVRDPTVAAKPLEEIISFSKEAGKFENPVEFVNKTGADPLTNSEKQGPESSEEEALPVLERIFEKEVEERKVSPKEVRSTQRIAGRVQENIQTYIKNTDADISVIEESKAEYISLPAPVPAGRQRERDASPPRIDIHIGKVMVDVRQDPSTVMARPQPPSVRPIRSENTAFQRGNLNRHYLRGY